MIFEFFVKFEVVQLRAFESSFQHHKNRINLISLWKDMAKIPRLLQIFPYQNFPIFMLNEILIAFYTPTHFWLVKCSKNIYEFVTNLFKESYWKWDLKKKKKKTQFLIRLPLNMSFLKWCLRCWPKLEIVSIIISL